MRARLEVLSNAWLFARARDPRRSWLMDFSESVLREYTKYILGKKVYGMKASYMDDKGNKVEYGSGPDWSVILNYDWEMRMQAIEWVKDCNMTMKEAFEKVVTDRDVRDLHFMDPWQLGKQLAEQE